MSGNSIRCLRSIMPLSQRISTVESIQSDLVFYPPYQYLLLIVCYSIYIKYTSSLNRIYIQYFTFCYVISLLFFYSSIAAFFCLNRYFLLYHFNSLDGSTTIFFFFLFFLGHTPGIWKFPGQGSNQGCSCQPTPQPQQCQILNPLSETRDQTCILVYTSRFPGTRTGTPVNIFFISSFRSFIEVTSVLEMHTHFKYVLTNSTSNFTSNNFRNITPYLEMLLLLHP